MQKPVSLRKTISRTIDGLNDLLALPNTSSGTDNPSTRRKPAGSCTPTVPPARPHGSTPVCARSPFHRERHRADRAQLAEATSPAQENRIGAAFVGWIAGCVVIWWSLFAIGNFLYAAGDPSRLPIAWMRTAVFVVGIVLMMVIGQLWADSTASQARADARRL